MSEYLPVTIDPEKLSHILTSIGLEVESMQPYEEVKGALQGLVIGEVLTTEKHPNADKLTLTTVHIGGEQPLHIVCGAPNVAAGQKVVVAPVGATIYPSTGEPLTMSQRKIRGTESQGMICAEDEIGLGTSHEGILVLPADVKVGMPAAEYFNPYSDMIYEIGLTPNRMDAMSHWGVARDVCAYLSHHDKKELKAQLPTTHHFKIDSTALTLQVEVENTNACQRYSGISLSNITVAPSPKWLKEKIKAIGLRPINNLVDITNYLQHETGQPLHVFDADKISGKKIIIKNLAAGTLFKTLDEKERTLSGDDLMICDDTQGLCIAGVFGGLESGVTDATKNIFLESAYFDGITLRKTSFRHGLRTDAATRFEKGTDISNTVEVLKRAAILIKELAGGEIASNIIDVYPAPKPKAEIAIKWSYIKKLSGKLYHPTAIANLLTSLGFDIINIDDDALKVAVPYHKPDISLPADIVEEIVRIDGLDNIEIPQSISITPSVDDHNATELYREKTANYLAGLGFNEMMTNSITNAAYYTPEEQQSMVKMTNSLSAELNILRPSLFETALEVVAHNLNHKNNSLRLFEFGKAYSTTGGTKYQEEEKLCIVISGNKTEDNWKQKATAADFYLLKGTIDGVLACLGIQTDTIEPLPSANYENHIVYKLNNDVIASAGEVSKLTREKFGIKQPVYFANLHWQLLAPLAVGHTPIVKEIAKYPAVQRDLAIVIDKSLTWNQVLQTIHKTKLLTLLDVKLFDIFESEKLGSGKKSVAINFTFLDEAKTLTDKEIDGWMSKIVTVLQKEIQAEIRK